MFYFFIRVLVTWIYSFEKIIQAIYTYAYFLNVYINKKFLKICYSLLKSLINYAFMPFWT